MTPWRWWAGADDDVFDIAEAKTREEVIALATREFRLGETFVIIEARSSTAARHDGADVVPFVRTRNREIVTVGPRP